MNVINKAKDKYGVNFVRPLKEEKFRNEKDLIRIKNIDKKITI